MSNSAERRLDALEALVRANSTALRRLPTVPERKVVPYVAPALGTWVVTTIKYNAASPPTEATDWDSWIDSIANYDNRRRSALPTRVGELNALFSDDTGSGATTNNSDHKRFFTAFDNNGPPYVAKLIVRCNCFGTWYIKHNGAVTTSSAIARYELDLNVQPGRNKVNVQMQLPDLPADIGLLQIEGVLFNPDQCVWKIGLPKGPFFAEITSDDGGGGGGGGGDSIGTDTGSGGGGIG